METYLCMGVGFILMHWLFVICCFDEANCFPCNQLGLKAEDIIQDVAVVRTERFRRRLEHSRLSFDVYMDPSFTSLPNSSEIRSLVVDPALKFFEDALYLRNPPVRLANANGSFEVGLDGSSHFVKGSTSFRGSDCKQITHCGPVAIPSEHLNSCRLFTDVYNRTEPESLVNTGSFLLYLAAKLTKRCINANILGYASHCQQEMNTDRPVAGFINFCLSRSGRVLDLSQLNYFVRHEVVHILGFSPSLYAFFRDANGKPLTPRQRESGVPALGWLDSARGIYKWSEKVIRTKVRDWSSALGIFQRKVHMVVTPTVLRFAREYFSCPRLEGVELENQGGIGVSLSHWEMRILGNELMTATYTNVFRLSNLTLAFLEDTGWYLPNYSLAEHLAWGAKRGCVFSTESCYSYILEQQAKEADVAPFCLTPQDKDLGDLFVCTPGRRSFGYCNLVQVTPKSKATKSHPMYTYFGNTSHLKYQGKAIPHDYFGKVDLADFCPFIQEVTWTGPDGVPLRSSYCGDHRSSKAITNLNNYNLEVYGPNSICLSIAPNWILLGRKSTAYEAPVRGAGCYKYRCSYEDGGLIVELAGGLQVLCPAGVSTAPVNISVCLREPALTVLGYFYCPECTYFCDMAVCFPRNFSKSSVARPFLKNGTIPFRSPILLQPCRGSAPVSTLDAITFVLVTLNSVEYYF